MIKDWIAACVIAMPLACYGFSSSDRDNVWDASGSGSGSYWDPYTSSSGGYWDSEESESSERIKADYYTGGYTLQHYNCYSDATEISEGVVSCKFEELGDEGEGYSFRSTTVVLGEYWWPGLSHLHFTIDTETNTGTFHSYDNSFHGKVKMIGEPNGWHAMFFSGTLGDELKIEGHEIYDGDTVAIYEKLYRPFRGKMLLKSELNALLKRVEIVSPTQAIMSQ